MANTSSDEREKAIFHTACSMPNAAQRQSYLQAACGDDGELRNRVDSLLSAAAEAGDFLELSPADSQVAITTGSLGVVVGTTIGPYKLLEHIGGGGFGDVFMADQLRPIQRRVALKIIKAGMDTKQVIARFEAERQALALMDHPNIAKVLDAGATETGRPYFVMELVRGVPVTEYCDDRTLSTQERLNIFIQICSAVQHAHQKGIIHRDIKPSNILVYSNGDRPVPKVIDFGIAKATQGRLTEKTLFTQFRQFIGTPSYMSPEQAQMSGIDIDTRSDIYSLGVLLYELLTSKTPLDAQGLSDAGLDEVCRRIREEETPTPSKRISSLQQEELKTVASNRRSDPANLPAVLRGDLDWIVMTAVEKDRTRRYQTADALAQEIQRHLNHEPVSAAPPSALYVLRRFAGRNRRLLAAVAAIAGALVLGTVISTWQAVRAERARRDATVNGRLAEQAAQRAATSELKTRQLAYTSDMNNADQALRLNNLGLARRLLDRNRPSYRGIDFRNWEWRALWKRCGDNAVSVVENPGRIIYSTSISRDGRWVATGDTTGEIQVWDVSSGQLEKKKTLSPRTAGQFGLVVFAPEDKLYATAADGVIKTWSVPSYSETPVLFRHRSRIRAIGLSSDGKRLASFGFDGMINLWDLDAPGKEPTQLDGGYAGGEQMGAVAISPDKQWLAVGLWEKIRIVNLKTLDQNLIPLPTKGVAVTSLVFSPDSEVLASGTGIIDGTIDLWRVSGGTLIDRLQGHTRYVFGLDYAPDGQQLVSCSADQTVRIWDMQTRRELKVLRGHESEVWSVDFAADGQIVSGGKDGAIRVWDQQRTTADWPISLPADTMPWGERDIYSQASFSHDGKWVATRQRDGTVSLRSAKNLEETRRLVDLGVDNRGVRFSPSERLLAVGDAAGGLTVLDPLQPERRQKRVELSPATEVFPANFTRDGKLLLVVARGESQSRCVIWNVAEGKELLSWPIPSDEQCAAISPDGKLVVTGHDDGTVRFWQDGHPPEPLRYGQTISGVAFSPDGGMLVIGSWFGEADLWDVDNRSSLGRLRGHMMGIHDVKFSPDGKRVATAGSSGESVKLWDLATQQEVATLIAEGYSFRQVEFSPDGNAILTVNAPGAIDLWRAPSWEDIHAAEETRGIPVQMP